MEGGYAGCHGSSLWRANARSRLRGDQRRPFRSSTAAAAAVRAAGPPALRRCGHRYEFATGIRPVKSTITSSRTSITTPCLPAGPPAGGRAAVGGDGGDLPPLAAGRVHLARMCGTVTPPTGAHAEAHRRTRSGPAADHRVGRKDQAGTAALVEAILASRPHPSRATAPRWASSGWPPLRRGRAEAACARALALRSYSYRSVESILRTGLDAGRCPATHPSFPHPRTTTFAAPATTSEGEPDDAQRDYRRAEGAAAGRHGRRPGRAERAGQLHRAGVR